MAGLDLKCGLCDGESDWQVRYLERHVGACREHLAWACGLLQTASHVSTVVEVCPSSARFDRSTSTTQHNKEW